MIDPNTGHVSPKWNNEPGTVLFVRQDRKPLAARHLEVRHPPLN
jgi:hypothetical protein